MEAIEGKSTREMSLAEIHNLLSGQPGSNVTVALVRARRAEPQKTVITRELVTIPPVADKMMEDGIGYLQVDAFPKGSFPQEGVNSDDATKDAISRSVSPRFGIFHGLGRVTRVN